MSRGRQKVTLYCPCGAAIYNRWANVTGLCRKCYGGKHGGQHGRHRRKLARCWTCRTMQLCPVDKDPRYFICDACRHRNDETDPGDRWLDGAGVSSAAFGD